MKKKIIIALTAFSLIFIASGISVISMKETSCAKLDNLVKLHQIEILRGHLLIHIKWVQSDLHLKGTQHERSMDTISGHVNVLSSIVNSCFECHHSPTVARKLTTLKYQVEDYQKALNRVFVTRADAAVLHQEEAFKIGARLISEVDTLTTVTSRKLDQRTKNAFDEITRTNRMLYMLLAVVPFVAIGMSIVFIRGFTRPVGELITATRRLKSGDLDYRIRALQDEYGEVANSFNEMADSLKAHCLRMQWAEQIVVLGELAGGLAHEVKNPLAGIKASMEVLSTDGSLSGENRDVLQKVTDQIKRIEVIMKSLLNFARPPKPQLTDVDMNNVLDMTISLAMRHPLFSSQTDRLIHMVKEYDPTLPRTIADPFQLQQVFMNLLLNAADAMPEGGTIIVHTFRDRTGEYLYVRIADTGEGIDDGIIDKIFQPFFTTKAKGTGLGLAITKRLIEQQEGGICVQNNPDRGVAFTITLPVLGSAEVQGT